MKKLLILACMIMTVVSIISCGDGSSSSSSANENATVTVYTPNSEREIIEVEVPFDPRRVVCLNYISVDIMDSLGLGDRIVGMIKADKSTVPAHLHKYVDDANVVNVGGMKEIDMEMVMSLEPDLILSSDRTSRQYNEFIKIAPTVSSSIIYADGFYEGFKKNAVNHAVMFGKEAELEKIFVGYDDRLQALQAKASGKTAMLILATGGKIHTLGDKGRISFITADVKFENVAADVDVNHGDISSYEFMVKANPDYIFVLDKDGAVGQPSTSAKELLDNELIYQTDAHKNGTIVYLEDGDVWYLADGGITSMDIIMKNMEKILANL